MSLREYKRKRHFGRTPEPKGKRAARGGRSFVIQKHAASRLHYDFRLELDGVLKSWAVPKGPSLDPSVKRLAMHVEDHPVEYGSFEGIIPEGEYGGGTVMLWDNGKWEPVGDPREGYRTGKLKFTLHGQKLHGAWMLVRTGGRSQTKDDQRRWLLFKERDDDAKSTENGDVLEEMPLSVSTGRSLEEIAADRDWVWGKTATSRRRTKSRTARRKKASRRKFLTKRDAAKVPDARAGKLPYRIDVELATLAKEVPNGDEWLHEIKLDGYRIICQIDHGHVDLISRNHKNWTDRLPSLAEAARSLPVSQAVLDGEVVAMRPDGVTDFQALQNAFRERRSDGLYYFVFDLLHVDGFDLARAPLEVRKRLLSELLTREGVPRTIRFSEHIEGNGPDFLEKACDMGLEGIISKRRDRPYEPGRGYGWLKVKCLQNEEYVIGGYTEPTGSRAGFGALLMGSHNRQGDLVYAGKVGTGFDDRTLRSLWKRLQALEQNQSPFSDRKRAARGVHWVAPKLVAQIAYGGLTREGILRHAAFQGLREDKPAAEVTREKPISLVGIRRKGRAMKKTRRNPKSKGAEYHAQKQQFAGVRLTSPDKVLYPEQGITKLDLARYYRAIADWILPHLKDRPVVLVRCPDGRGKACFYQKHPGVGTPDTLRQIPIREKTKTEPYVIVDDVAGLISLAQVGALEIHAWGSRADMLERPDRLIFDLDPDPQVSWHRVVQSARQVRQFLAELGLECFVKTTGGKGLHLVAPIDRRHEWNEVKAFCKQVADLIVAADPDQYTANMSKAARHGKIFIDYLRNGRGATAVVPYSPRARPGAPVSTPLAWAELSAQVRSDHFTIQNIEKRLATLKRDPWEGMDNIRQGLAGPLKKLRTLS